MNTRKSKKSEISIGHKDNTQKEHYNYWYSFFIIPVHVAEKLRRWFKIWLVLLWPKFTGVYSK